MASSASLGQKGRRVVIRGAAHDRYSQVLRQVLIKAVHRAAVSAVVLGHRGAGAAGLCPGTAVQPSIGKVRGMHAL